MKLIEKILGKIQQAATAGDLDSIAHLNQLAKRVREIEEGQSALEADLVRISAEVDGSVKTNSPQPMLPGVSYNKTGPIVVILDFPRLGINRPQVVISERQASETMRKVMEVLVEVKGLTVLDQLAQLRVNRGPLVSGDPVRDYTNPQSGQLYSHQRIGNTGYSVLTHSATAEKIRDLKKVAGALNFSALHFRVYGTENQSP